MHAIYARDKATWIRYTSDRYQSIYDKGTIKTKQSISPAASLAYTDTVAWSGTPSVRTIGAADVAADFRGPDATTESEDLAVGTFSRDSSGHVNGYIYRRCDGQTINIPRTSENTKS